MKWKLLVLFGVLALGTPSLAQEAKETPSPSEPELGTSAREVADGGASAGHSTTEQLETEEARRQRILQTIRLSGFGRRETILLRKNQETIRMAVPVKAEPEVLPEVIPASMPDGVDVPDQLQIYLRDGRDAILNRHYEEAEEIFTNASEEFPKSPVGPMGLMVLHQSVMLENFDFSREEEFMRAGKIAKKRVDATLEERGNDAWDYLIAGAYHGVMGVHELRRHKYVGSLGSGWDAIRSLKASEAETEELRDIDLGLGAYDYFRSVIKRQAPWVPFFPDRRAQGIARMVRTRNEGEFTRPIAQIALIFTFIDERRNREAIDECKDLLDRYPDNIIARVALGRAYSRSGKYKKAIAEFEEVKRRHPDNRVVHYYLGSNRLYQGKDLDQAEADLIQFLEDPPTEQWKGWAYERMGDIYKKRKDMKAAVHYWKKAKKINPGDKSVKRKLARAAEEPKPQK